QATALLLFSTPDEWYGEIVELNDQLCDGIESVINSAASLIDDMSIWKAIAIGAAGGSVGGPLGTVLGGIEGGLALEGAKALLHSKLADAAKEIWASQRALVASVEHALDALFGNPQKLTNLGLGYVTAKTSCDTAWNRANTTSTRVGVFWEGLAYRAFSNAAANQEAAIEAMGEKLLAASHLMADAAEAIKQCWSDVVQALVALVADILGTAGEAVDLGKIFAGEFGKPFEVIGDCLGFVNSVTSSIRSMAATAKTQGVMDWADLNSGSKALVNGAWPKIEGIDNSIYGNDGNWNVQH
ncbi:MAG: hypothetical protein JWO76_1092, partial [Nocardioides sp.]|nr:hypothetical protein [Nocardioides sp.]